MKVPEEQIKHFQRYGIPCGKALTNDELALFIEAPCELWELVLVFNVTCISLTSRLIDKLRANKTIRDLTLVALGGIPEVQLQLLFHDNKTIDRFTNYDLLTGHSSDYSLGHIVSMSESVDELNVRLFRNSENFIPFFQALEKNTKITNLTLYDAPPGSMYLLSKSMGNLLELTLKRCTLNALDCQALAMGLRANPKLVELKMIRCTATSENISTVIRSMEHVDTFYMEAHENALDCRGAFEDLLLNNSKLKDLVFNNVELMYGAIKGLANGIARGTKLFLLFIENCKADPTGMSDLLDILIHDNSVAWLSVNNSLRDNGETIIPLCRIMEQNKNLRFFDISNNNINSFLMAQICATLAMNKCLTTFRVKGNCFDDGAIDAYAHAISSHPAIQMIDLSSCKLTDDMAISVLKAAAQSQSISEVNLDANFLSGSIIPAVRELVLRNKQLFILQLKYNRLNDDDFIALAPALKDVGKLGYLCLEYNDARQPGINALIDVLSSDVFLTTDCNTGPSHDRIWEPKAAPAKRVRTV